MNGQESADASSDRQWAQQAQSLKKEPVTKWDGKNLKVSYLHEHIFGKYINKYWSIICNDRNEDTQPKL